MAQQHESLRQRITRFVTSVKGLILTIGALAGAVAAVLALLPGEEPVPPIKASFSRVTAYPNVGLEEYEDRFESRDVAKSDGHGHAPPVLSVPYRLVDDTDSSTSKEEGESTVETTTETNVEPSTTEEPEPSTTVTAPLHTAPFKETNAGLARSGNGTDPAKEHAIAEALSNVEVPLQQIKAAANSPESGSAEVVVPECNSPSCPLTAMIGKEASHSNPAKAARALAAAFADSRGRVIHHKLYPSGAAVNYTIELVGFKGHEAILEWSLWSKAEVRPLPKHWLRNVVAEEIKPKAEDESFAGQFWIPTPHPRGDYVVHLTAYDSEHVERGEAETEPPFH